MTKTIRLLTAVLGLLLATSATAAVISPEKALRRVFASGNNAPATRASEKSFALVLTVESPSGPAVYQFSNGTQSLLASADEAAPALLGYFDEARADEAGSSPEFLYWINQYALQINYLRQNPNTGVVSTVTTRGDAKSPIQPMVKTMWNQEAPFNDMCPIVDGKRSVTGCVATAMAQVINWHRWPVTGKGSFSYKLNGQTISFNYGNTAFDWDNMADVYDASSTDAQKKAVATLMLACGVSVQMDYTPDESGASAEIIPSQLVEYFNFDKGTVLFQRDLFSATAWNDAIYSQLTDYGPVIYAGQSNEGGHCFVADGYSDGYFHINWGWGGLDNGYFLLSILDPGDNQGVGGTTSGYSFDQSAVANMTRPKDNSKPTIQIGMLSPFKIDLGDLTSVAKGSTVKVVGNCTNISIVDVSGRFGLIAVDANGKQYVGQSESTFSLQPWYYYSGYSSALPSLPQGDFKLYPAYKPDGGTWQIMPAQTGCVTYYDISVGSRSVSFTKQDLPSVGISGITVKSKVFADAPLLITGTLANNSGMDYSGAVQLIIVDSEDNPVAQGYKYLLDANAGTTSDFTYSGEISPAGQNSIDPGEYTGYFTDPMTGTVISDDFAITVSQTPANTQISIANLTVAGTSDAVDNKEVTFSADVTCTEGYYSGYLNLYVFPEAGGTSVAYLKSEAVFAGEGETVKAIFKGAIPGTENGSKYFAGIYFDNQWAAQSGIFTVSDAAAPTLSDDDNVVAMDVFTTSGQHVASSKTGRADLTALPAGIYIIRAVTSDGKVKSLRRIIE